ncbi:hypothetical protein [Bacillus wiedmannii]
MMLSSFKRPWAVRCCAYAGQRFAKYAAPASGPVRYPAAATRRTAHEN